MRRLLVSLLPADGHVVVEAGDGPEARTPLLGRPGGPGVDLVVTGRPVAGCTRLGLLAVVRSQRPLLPVGLDTCTAPRAPLRKSQAGSAGHPRRAVRFRP